MILLALVLLSFADQAGSCVLKEGVGLDFARINVTIWNGNSEAPAGMIVNSDGNGLVKELIVTNKGCQTSIGVRVGDFDRTVVEIYGKGKKVSYHMTKGSTTTWKLGDFSLEYPGVSFVISKDKVEAIIIKPLIANSDSNKK